MHKVTRLGSVAITSSACILLAIEWPVWNLNFFPIKAVAISQQTQETSINLSAADLRQPYILSISTSQAPTQITGEIRLNGRLIQKLSRTSARINLAPSLKVGKNVVAVSGKYSPANTSVNVEFSGPSTQVSQQMAGNGLIKQTLIIKVE
jgi:hypothetical protein